LAPDAGTRELVATACTFGNSLTLPLVFMDSLMAPAAFDRAIGYTALFLTGCSPLLWSLGYSQLTSAGFAADAPGGALCQALLQHFGSAYSTKSMAVLMP
jgi:predicted permease